MTRDLRSEVVAALADRPMTVTELALSLRVRRADVTDALAAGGFVRAETPAGASRRAVHWTVAPTVGNASRRVLSGCDRILALLRDGRPHSHHELYRLHCIAHSRVSELRRRGHVIETWRDGDTYWYRMLVARERQAA